MQIPDSMRSKIGTVAHNRSFSIRELAEYAHIHTEAARGIVRALVSKGMLRRVDQRGQYYPTATGWDWIEGKENPLTNKTKNVLVGTAIISAVAIGIYTLL